MLVSRWHSPAFAAYREASGPGAAELVIDLHMLAAMSPADKDDGELWRSAGVPHTVETIARILRREDVVIAAAIETMRRYDIMEICERVGLQVFRLTWWRDQLPLGGERSDSLRQQKRRDRIKQERQAIVDGRLPVPYEWRAVWRALLLDGPPVPG
jgi:hypothetical protein